MSTRIVPAVALCCATAIAAAETTSTRDTPPLETVVVTAHPLSAEGLALASDVLEGQELARKLESSIGETVGREPGVHAANFGQAASRPVIHGLSGPRVRIMEDRIDALDVSVTSADHAVTIDPFMADHIEILKGPSSLLYGTGAIGGVVDVHTGRIPHEPASTPLSGRAEGRFGNNADRKTGALRLDGGTGSIAWHVDAFSREADDYEIPGHVESAALRAREAAAQADDDHEVHEDEDAGDGTLAGSAMDTEGAAAGVSFVGSRGFAGVAVSRLESVYGLPGGHEHEEDHAEEEHDEEAAQQTGTPTVDLRQTRVDLEAGVTDPLPGFEALNVRIGINDYKHQELEPDGAVATTFENDAVETRIELTHSAVAGWRGAVGVQHQDRDFSAVGEEAFIAPVDTRSLGAFWVGEHRFDAFDLEAGIRLGSVDVDPSDGDSRDFTTYAASLGVVVPFAGHWSVGLLGDYSARAPIAEELFSDGPHLATGTFEVGNPALDVEKALSLSANLRYADDGWFFNATLYHIDFHDYIYEAPTGAEEDGLPVFAFAQAGAEYRGLDVEVRRTVADWVGGSIELSAQFDTVSADLDVAGNDQIPRLPPERYGIGAAGHWGMIRGSVDYLRVRKQSDTAEFELPTPGYDDLRAFLGADVPVGGSTVTVFVQGRNLTDDDQRQHSSFIKDVAPLPGRTLEAGIRARF